MQFLQSACQNIKNRYCATFDSQCAIKKKGNMAYSEKAKALRKCKAKKKNGESCQAWAVWGEGFCVAHSRRHHKGPMPSSGERRKRNLEYLMGIKKEPRRSPVCHCSAYNWPHRPGGGLCNWPDEPIGQCRIPAGTHGWRRFSYS